MTSPWLQRANMASTCPWWDVEMGIRQAASVVGQSELSAFCQLCKFARVRLLGYASHRDRRCPAGAHTGAVGAAPDCPVVLAQGLRRGTHCVRVALCVQTAATRMFTKRASRANPWAAFLGAPEIAPAGQRLPRVMGLGFGNEDQRHLLQRRVRTRFCPDQPGNRSAHQMSRCGRYPRKRFATNRSHCTDAASRQAAGFDTFPTRETMERLTCR